MIKTNSKQAIANIWKYLNEFIEIINDERMQWEPDFEPLQDGDKVALATFIYYTYEEEKKNNDNLWKTGRITDQELFADWAQGLPLCGMFDFWYYCTAVDTLGAILEETETEKARFTEGDAEKLLTNLIYREVIKNKDNETLAAIRERREAAKQARHAAIIA